MTTAAKRQDLPLVPSPPHPAPDQHDHYHDRRPDDGRGRPHERDHEHGRQAAASTKPTQRAARSSRARPIMIAARLATCSPLTESMCAVPDRRKASSQPSSMPAVSPMTTPCSTSFTRASGPEREVLPGGFAQPVERAGRPSPPPERRKPAAIPHPQNHLYALLKKLPLLIEAGIRLALWSLDGGRAVKDQALTQPVTVGCRATGCGRRAASGGLAPV